jgi:hypothetical protein
MDDETIVVILVVVAMVLLTRRPVPSVSTSSSVLLPDGRTVYLEPVATNDVGGLRDALNSILWQ